MIYDGLKIIELDAYFYLNQTITA